jgi:hypothetical protein
MALGLATLTTGQEEPRETAEEVGLGVARREPGCSMTTSIGTRTNQTTKEDVKIASTLS